MAVLTCFENNDRRNMIYPSESPDVNLIKKIRSWMKKDTEEVKPTTCDDFKAALFRSYDIIPPAKIGTVFLYLLGRAAAIMATWLPY